MCNGVERKRGENTLCAAADQWHWRILITLVPVHHDWREPSCGVRASHDGRVAPAQECHKGFSAVVTAADQLELRCALVSFVPDLLTFKPMVPASRGLWTRQRIQQYVWDRKTA